jgi:NAD(P)-dependent dehydrogenase (short-subunit alcohol dehydrogenase family)
LFCAEDNYTKGCFCDLCYKIETEKRDNLQISLKQSSNLNAIVTGGRCGLGQEIVKTLSLNGINTLGTTRFPSDENQIKLDLKDPSTWSDIKEKLESGTINILVLSASETLHYPGDDELSKNWKDVETDWTNDFKRDNSGVWHKCLNQHSYEEIMSPLIANVGGSASLLGFWLNGVKKKRSEERLENKKNKEKSKFCCIVVTSYEGRFKEKTPFHPITNACKSALEQIVWTVKEQADFLDCNVLLSDPGWVYTEGSFGKIRGPVPIEFGASQILQPLVASFENNAKNGETFRRADKQNQRSEVSLLKEVELTLEPCGHIVKQNYVLNKTDQMGRKQVSHPIYKCNECDNSYRDIKSRNIVL